MSSGGVEERLARKLASNDLPTRNKALKRLKKWMAARSTVENGFTELELLKLWKGLHICMWHSDKPLVQEELAENIASLVSVFHTPDTALQFIDAFFATISREWHSIDRLRLDKYYMLIRKVIHHSLHLLQQSSWRDSLVETFISQMEGGPLCHDISKTTLGIQLHVVEVFLPQLVTVVARDEADTCPPSHQLLHPFTQLLAHTRDTSVVECVCTNVMDPLLNDGEKVASLCLDAGSLSAALRGFAISRDTVGRNRKTLYNYCKRFSELGTRDGSDTTVPAKEKEHYKQSPPQDEQLPPAKIKRRRKKKD